MKMKITVVLTSYNHEKFLAQSIESVLGQTYKDFEFIIVDDCSQDSSWDIICRYKEKYPQIVTVHHSYNWHGGSVDDIVKNYATGDYIALHHSDDIWEPDKLQKQVNVLEEHPEYSVVFTNAVAIDDNGEPYHDENGFYYRLFSVQNKTRFQWLNHFFYQGNCLCHPSILVRKDVYEEDDFFRKGLQQIPDYVKWIQICKRHEIYVLPDSLVKFRIHNEGKNTSGMRADTQIRSTVELYLMLQEYVEIQDREEFLTIFPQAQEYCTKEFFSAEYAFGRICTEEGMPPYTRLFGIQLLYKVLNDPAQAEVIRTEFGYTHQFFKKENGKYDIFGILPKSFEQRRTIYIDYGDGYDSENSFSESFTLGQNETYEMKLQLTAEEGKVIRGIRFDPAEGVMLACKIERAAVNNAVLEIQPQNALCSRDGMDVFVDLDPRYSVEIPAEVKAEGETEIIISGEIKRITDDELDQAVMSEMYKKRDMIYMYQGKVQAAEDEKWQLVAEREQLAVEKEQLTGEKLQLTAEKEQLIMEKEQLTGDKIQLMADKEQLENYSAGLEKNNAELTAALERIRSTRMYRLYAKVKGIKEKLWRK